MSESMTFEYEQFDDEEGLLKEVRVAVPHSGVLVEVLTQFRDFLQASGFPYVEHLDAFCDDVVHSTDPEVEFEVEDDEDFDGEIEDYIGDIEPTETPFMRHYRADEDYGS